MKCSLSMIATVVLAGSGDVALAQPVSKGLVGLQADESKTPCVLAATIVGEGALREALARELLLLGVSTQHAGDCPSVGVQIGRTETGIVVSLRDASGREASRVLSDLRIAATWIDSWLHEDLGAPLLATRHLSSFAVPAAAASGDTTSLDIARAPRLTSLAGTSRWHIGGSYDSIGGDSVGWTGFSVDVCKGVGPLCLGVTMRGLQTSQSSLSSDSTSEFSRDAAEALALVRLPIAIGRVVVSPSFALGASLMRTDAKVIDSCAPSANPGPWCGNPDVYDQSRSDISWAPRADVGLSILLPIASQVSLQLGGTLGLRLWGRGESRLEGSGDVPPPLDPCSEPNTGGCNGTVDPGIPPPPIVLSSAEPGTASRLFIGLEIGL